MGSRRLVLLFLLFSASALLAQAPSQGVVGIWMEPTGSVIRIEPCGPTLCARLIAISKAAPTNVDNHNPDPAKRSVPLCGLTIGQGFQLTDPTHAEGGTLYDPKTGKTYRGAMKAEGDELDLRGYVGIKLFGESQTWKRVAHPPAPCSSSEK